MESAEFMNLDDFDDCIFNEITKKNFHTKHL